MRSSVDTLPGLPRAAGIQAVLDQRLVLCLGCGGVGKTTIAAALAVAAAERGKRVVVLTVDPARRLKSALGLDAMDHRIHRVPIGAGRFLDALMLDTKRMFDALVERFAASPEAAARIFQNRIYQEISSELAGSSEYMAMEKLHELASTGEYDTIVLDTPPSAHVRDLLAAPNRLLSLLASRAVRILKAPTVLLDEARSRTARIPLQALLKALERLTGLPLLRELADFVSGFEHMLEGFARRAQEIETLVRAPHTAHVLVTTAAAPTARATEEFCEELRSLNCRPAGIIANQLYVFSGADPGEARRQAAADAFRAKLWKNYQRLHAIGRQQAQTIRDLCKATALPLLAVAPAFVRPPGSMRELRAIASLLLEQGAPL